MASHDRNQRKGYLKRILRQADMVEISQLDSLQVIHVTGTCGKGSTCALIDSMLRTYSEDRSVPCKVGMYTSPHIYHVRERIRINGADIPEDDFVSIFDRVLEAVPASATPELDYPRYLQTLFLGACLYFVEQKVDVAIIETHCGGEYDATNVVSRPRVAVVTPISLDHVDLLGPTITDIAWHKGGIFKPGSMALSAPQPSLVAGVLRQRANGNRVKALEFAHGDEPWRTRFTDLLCRSQLDNVGLAKRATETWLGLIWGEQAMTLSSTVLQASINGNRWPGRFHRFDIGKRHWFIDGGHNHEGIAVAAQWFLKDSQHNIPTILIFAQLPSREDLFPLLLRTLGHDIAKTTYILTTTTESSLDTLDRGRLEILHKRKATLKRGAQCIVAETIESSVERVRDIPHVEANIFATGSLHLAGGLLRQLACRGSNLNHIEHCTLYR